METNSSAIQRQCSENVWHWNDTSTTVQQRLQPAAFEDKVDQLLWRSFLTFQWYLPKLCLAESFSTFSEEETISKEVIWCWFQAQQCHSLRLDLKWPNYLVHLNHLLTTQIILQKILSINGLLICNHHDQCWLSAISFCNCSNIACFKYEPFGFIFWAP